MIHPLDISDVARKFPWLKRVPDGVVKGLLRLMPPVCVGKITGVKSAYGETEGWFVGCPLTTDQMLGLPEEYVLGRIIRTGKLAENLGANILGLGAMTSVVGDAGVTVASQLDMAVTTGNSYTVATALEGTKLAAGLMEHDLRETEVAVVGATGSIGAVCARLLAREVRFLTLVGRQLDKLNELRARILSETGLAAQVTSDIGSALKRADVIITVTSSADAVIEPQHLKPGAVVCDVARPRDVSRQVAEQRQDVLVIEGGVVSVPGDVQFPINFGYPPGTALACMAETMILALEERCENFTLGREISLEQVEEISRLAKKHGFSLAGLRSFERPVTLEDVERVKLCARKYQGGIQNP